VSVENLDKLNVLVNNVMTACKGKAVEALTDPTEPFGMGSFNSCILFKEAGLFGSDPIVLHDQDVKDLGISLVVIKDILNFKWGIEYLAQVTSSRYRSSSAVPAADPPGRHSII